MGPMKTSKSHWEGASKRQIACRSFAKFAYKFTFLVTRAQYYHVLYQSSHVLGCLGGWPAGFANTLALGIRLAIEVGGTSHDARGSPQAHT